MKVISIKLILFILISLSVRAESDNFYLSSVKQAKLTQEDLTKSAEKVKEHKKITVYNDLEVPPFHKRQIWEKQSLSKTFCTDCHQSPPHREDLRSRTFLNMHTEFIACETCHMRPKDVTLEYSWLNYENKQKLNAEPTLFRQQIDDNDIAKNSERKQRETHKLHKIAPYYAGQPALIFKDHPYAEQTRQIWKNGSVEERVKRRAKIHLPMEEKGPECKACHQKDKPMLDLAVLGANPRQVRGMQNHIVPQFFERYQEKDQKIKINSLLQ